MLITPWEEDNTWDAGYLAGFFDGEGCVCQATNKGAISPHYALSVNATQRDNEALAATTAALHRCKVRHSVVAYDNQHVAMRRISILGTATDKLRFLGRFRPARLLANLDPLRLGALRNTPSQYSGKKHTHYRQTVHVVRAVPIGMQTVCGLETTSKTYIAEGFGCHNSHFDLPWIRTRALKHGIPCNWNFKVFDTLVEARRRLYLNSNSLDYISKFLDRKGKTKTDFSWWIDVMNDKPGALDRMVRYCKRDVRELEAVFHRISAHLGHKTHRGVQEGGSKWQCPLCGSAKVSPHKPRTTAAGTIQHQMQCGKCHKYYTISVASYEKMLEERTT